MKDKKLSTELMDEIQLDFFYEIKKMDLSPEDHISMLFLCLEILHFHQDGDFFDEYESMENY